MYMKRIKSIMGDTYEVSNLYPNRRENTDVYSCDNNCTTCETQCELGAFMLSQIDNVGA